MHTQWASNRDCSNLISNDVWGQDSCNLKFWLSISCRSKRDSKYISHKRSVLCLHDISDLILQNQHESNGAEKRNLPHVIIFLNPPTWNIVKIKQKRTFIVTVPFLGHKNYKCPNFMSDESQAFHVGNNISTNDD